MTPDDRDTPRAVWDFERREYLLDSLIAQSALGKKTDGASGWKKEAWESIRKSLNEKFNLRFTVKQLKEAFNNLKKDYQIVKELRGLSGFGWDDANELVTAASDIWDAYFAKHPDRGRFRTRPFPYYDKMHEICDGRMPTGDGKLYPSMIQGTPCHQYNTDTTNDSSETSLSDAKFKLDNDSDIASDQDEENTPPGPIFESRNGKRRFSTSSCSTTPGRGPGSAKRASKTNSNAQHLSNAIMYLGDKLASSFSNNQPPDVVDYRKEAIRILKEMKDDYLFSKEEAVRAINLLMDGDKATMFCLMEDEDLRVAYVKMELGSEGSTQKSSAE